MYVTSNESQLSNIIFLDEIKGRGIAEGSGTLWERQCKTISMDYLYIKGIRSIIVFVKLRMKKAYTHK